MSYKEAVTSCFMKYVQFSGRASRSEYWWFMLFSFLVSSVLEGLAYLVGTPTDPNLFISLLLYAFGLVIFLPTLAVSVRRMHDLGKGGGWIFISAVPLIGWIWYIVLAATPGEPFENRFGPVPA